jgi:septal ring factor EnvC (AmiA/AmiB activator)
MSTHNWPILTALVVGATLSMSSVGLGEPKPQPKFIWPADGRLITGFCKSLSDTRPNGINLTVSPGTEVHAVESGQVAYAGNELKGFRNLILISHDDGWVSAYAQSDEVLVNRNEAVARGQVIARFGRPDPGESLRLHFELRKGTTPLDPLAYLGSADVAATTKIGCRG